MDPIPTWWEDVSPLGRDSHMGSQSLCGLERCHCLVGTAPMMPPQITWGLGLSQSPHSCQAASPLGHVSPPPPSLPTWGLGPGTLLSASPQLTLWEAWSSIWLLQLGRAGKEGRNIPGLSCSGWEQICSQARACVDPFPTAVYCTIF